MYIMLHIHTFSSHLLNWKHLCYCCSIVNILPLVHILGLIVAPVSDADTAVSKERVVADRHPPGRMMNARNVENVYCASRFMSFTF